jgi:dipeptidyl-peptidase-4
MSAPNHKISFPRQFARTRHFMLGQPRSFHIAGDGSRIVFLRSKAGDDPVTCLWVLDLDTGQERLVCDPREIDGSDRDLPPEERVRRERVREFAEGVVAYASDPGARLASFALGGRLFVSDLTAGGVREFAAAGAVNDPRVDPTGRRVAYVADRALHVVYLDVWDRVVAAEEDPDVTWGLPEFVAAEEMGRHRGYWWAPDGEALAAARVDERPVQRWHIADPADPSLAPVRSAYPAAGTPNAVVTLSVFSLEGGRTDVDWDVEAFPYLARVMWDEGRPLTLLVQSRDQRVMRVLAADSDTGKTETLREDRDRHWLEIVDGIPSWLADGRLVFAEGSEDTRRLVFEDQPVTPPGLHVKRVLDAGESVVFAASDEPTEMHLWRASAAGDAARLTERPGVHDGAARGDVVVVAWGSMDEDRTTTVVRRAGTRIATIESLAERPLIQTNATLLRLGRRELRSALLLPSGGEFDGPLPVLVDPYGGPHFQRVVRARSAFLQSQWFADQGFAVLVADGRGTPGRGLAWETAVAGDLATAPLEDQVDALLAAAEAEPRLDLSRVAIRGWSFGGYLAALAVLRRPDVFHAAIAGAPVTDWHLYDTHYTERYLGHPDAEPEAYRQSSLLDEAVRLERPLLLIHGLADDNVVVAHTLRLSRALLEAGRPHSVLPLSGVTHMTPQEAVAENLLLLQVEFLRNALSR